MLKKTAIILSTGVILAFLLITAGCLTGNTLTKYLYLKPITTVYDTAWQPVADMGEVSYTAHVVHVYLPASEFQYTATLSNPFLTSAYASRKEYHDLKALEQITDIRIITLNNYNSMFPAGSNIADSCEFSTHKTEDSTNYTAIDQRGLSKKSIINSLNAKNYDYSNHFSAASPTKTFSFRVKLPPAIQGQQQFAIEFETKTPSKFGDTTTHFILKP